MPGSFIPLDAARGFDTYEDARRMEVRFLEFCRLHDIIPNSPEGENLLTVLRTKFEE